MTGGGGEDKEEVFQMNNMQEESKWARLSVFSKPVFPSVILFYMNIEVKKSKRNAFICFNGFGFPKNKHTGV